MLVPTLRAHVSDRDDNGDWTPGMPSPPLSHADVHIVLFPIDAGHDDAGLEWLDDDERARAARFIRSEDARRFVAAHAMVRVVLGRCLDVAPTAVRFTVDTYGKPVLCEAESGIRFNLSHSGDRALLAIATRREIGVDIERERDIEVLDLATRFFAPGECRSLSALPVDHRLSAFYRCWTRKESFIKARGHGLSFPLNGFEVGLADESELVACPAAPSELQRWTMASLPVEKGYAAAVTVEGREWRPILWKSAPFGIRAWPR